MKHYPLSPYHIEKALAYPDNYGRIDWFAYLLDTFLPNQQHTDRSATNIAQAILRFKSSSSWMLANAQWMTIDQV